MEKLKRKFLVEPTQRIIVTYKKTERQDVRGQNGFRGHRSCTSEAFQTVIRKIEEAEKHNWKKTVIANCSACPHKYKKIL
jgi:hypothetical protein